MINTELSIKVCAYLRKEFDGLLDCKFFGMSLDRIFQPENFAFSEDATDEDTTLTTRDGAFGMGHMYAIDVPHGQLFISGEVCIGEEIDLKLTLAAGNLDKEIALIGEGELRTFVGLFNERAEKTKVYAVPSAVRTATNEVDYSVLFTN